MTGAGGRAGGAGRSDPGGPDLGGPDLGSPDLGSPDLGSPDLGSPDLDEARRARELEALAAGAPLDLLVVGGGVTGAGVALDAASRGLRVALLERRDLAFGTSRWSSKLVHGGLRYLAADPALALESSVERGILMERTAPHLVRPLAFLLPLGDAVPTAAEEMLEAGLRAGDALRKAARTAEATLPAAGRLTTAQALAAVPGLRRAGLRGALRNAEGQLEDDARLVVALARTAAAHGACVLTGCAVEAADGTGARVRPDDGATFEVRARNVVNATGVWAGTLEPRAHLSPSRGAHLVLAPGALAGSGGAMRAALTVPVPGERNRFVFAVPQPDGHVHVGLTDDPASGPVPDVPEVTAADHAFLLGVLSTALERPVTDADVVGGFAGLRPLLAGAGATADLSRRHALLVGDEGMLSLVGGKLTTYRLMAAEAVDRVTDRPCRTRNLPLVGAAPPAVLARVDAPARLVRRYGTEAPRVAALAGRDPTLLRPVADGVATLGVELAFGLACEGARGVEDLLERRTRLSLVPAEAAAARPLAERLVAARPAAAGSTWPAVRSEVGGTAPDPVGAGR